MTTTDDHRNGELMKDTESTADAGPGATTAPASHHVVDNEKIPESDVPSSKGSEVAQDHANGEAAGTEAQEHGKEATKKPGDTDPERQRSKAKIALIMSALCMAVFLAALDVTIITTALPTIAQHFGSAAGYTWIGSAYLLANAASTPVWGKLSDIWGRKIMILVANVIFFVGSLVAALANSIGMLIAARAVQGLGGGGLIVLTNICIGDLFSMRSRGAYYGMIGGVWAVASAVGPLVGGAFTENVSWRWCFYINLPLDGLAFIIIFFFLDLPIPKTPVLAGLKAVDWFGVLTIVGGTLMFLFGLEFGGETYPWSSATVVCLIVFGVVTWAIFIIIEWKVAISPIIPLHIFKKRSNVAALLVCFCHGAVFIAGSYYLPLYFQAVLGATPILSGVYLLPTALSLSFCSVAGGITIKKTGAYLPLIIGGMSLLTLGYGLLIDLDANSSWAKIIIYQIIGGIGTGPNFQAPLIALQTLVHPRDIATATSCFGFTRNLATSISVVVGNVLYQNQLQKKLPSLPPVARNIFQNGQGSANVYAINSLPPDAKDAARQAFAQSLSTMWILYTIWAFIGLLASFLITKNTMAKTHQETKTGLEAEKERAEARKAEKEAKAEKRRSKGAHGEENKETNV